MSKTINIIAVFSLVFGLFNGLWAYEDGQLLSVGKDKTMLLPFRDPNRPDSMARESQNIGTGAEGEVFLKKVPGQEDRAVKLIPADSFNIHEIQGITVGGLINIGPKYFDSWVTEKDGRLHVAVEMEKMPGSSMSYMPVNILRPNQAAELKALKLFFGNNTLFFDQLFTMLLKLAKEKLSYIDIKYGNIMKNNNEIKLVDFGSTQVHDTIKDAARRILKSRAFENYSILFEVYIPADEQEGTVAKEALQELRNLAK